jgi:AraC family ethanolamine operon transcriptional activator
VLAAAGFDRMAKALCSIASNLLPQIAGETRPLPTRAEVAVLARAYMLENIDTPIPISALCSPVAVSERTLRTAFRETYGMSPSRYFKLLRLAHVRTSLERSTHRRTTVLCEAVKAGFWHMGRFAAEYKDRFGELPSVTLRTPPGRAVTRPSSLGVPDMNVPDRVSIDISTHGMQGSVQI